VTLKTVDAKLMQKMFLAAAQSIEAKKEYINELNVFPVPDGDTGTNMTLTIMSAAKEVSTLVDPDMESLAKAISSGSLRGARGNSGVILSQLFRGFTKVIREYEEIDVEIAANAFTKAVETAYKAVMKPKEGTILTVARGGAEKAAELVGEVDDLIEFMDAVIAHMEEVLEYTPELLPVLKEAGVVDSGGQGLLEIVKGAYEVLCGREVEFKVEQPVVRTASQMSSENISTADIKFGYCTEFIIMLEKKYDDDDELAFKAYLESIGDSIVVVSDDGIVKVHVHTNDPGLAIQKALTFGSLTRMKIDNMREEHNEKLNLEAERAAMEAKNAEKQAEKRAKTPKKPVGFIAVSIGAGINEIFTGLGVDYLIEGGQTMNPSTEDMLNAIDAVNADTIFILPNNKNIILAADQAKAMTEDKNIVVIPSKTVPQGIAAIISYVAGSSAEDNEAVMIESMKAVKTGQVTYAVRDTKVDGKDIKMGDFMGIDDRTIQSVGNDMAQVSLELAESMIDDDTELISIYYGEETGEDDAQELASKIEEKHPMIDIEVHPGNQPIYYYIISAE